MKADSVFVVPRSMLSKARGAGLVVKEENLVSVVPGEMYEASGVRFETVPAYNSFKPFHLKGKSRVGYILTMNNLRYYVAGDTDATKEARAVKCDVAMVPIGGVFTVNAKRAAKLVDEIRPLAAVPFLTLCQSNVF